MASGLPCYPDAETPPRRDETQFLKKKYECIVSNMLQERSFLVPLKFFDVARRTHTTLDVLQECQKYEFWNMDSGRTLSGC